MYDRNHIHSQLLLLIVYLLFRHEKKPENKEIVKDLEKKLTRRKVQLYEMEEALPKMNGLCA